MRNGFLFHIPRSVEQEDRVQLVQALDIANEALAHKWRFVLADPVSDSGPKYPLEYSLVLDQTLLVGIYVPVFAEPSEMTEVGMAIGMAVSNGANVIVFLPESGPQAGLFENDSPIATSFIRSMCHTPLDVGSRCADMWLALNACSNAGKAQKITMDALSRLSNKSVLIHKHLDIPYPLRYDKGRFMDCLQSNPEEDTRGRAVGKTR